MNRTMVDTMDEEVAFRVFLEFVGKLMKDRTSKMVPSLNTKGEMDLMIDENELDRFDDIEIDTMMAVKDMDDFFMIMRGLICKVDLKLKTANRMKK
jgi:hypothetical protein